MGPAVLLLVKALVAGCLVALISQLSTALRPKMFAGLFAAAPSVAAVSLVLNGLQKPASITPAGQGMIAGAAGMIGCCLAVMVLVPKLHSLVASAAGWLAWATAAVAAYLGIWR